MALADRLDARRAAADPEVVEEGLERLGGGDLRQVGAVHGLATGSVRWAARARSWRRAIDQRWVSVGPS